jgi:hypothetical protein
MRVPEPSPRHAGAKRNLGSGAAPPGPLGVESLRAGPDARHRTAPEASVTTTMNMANVSRLKHSSARVRHCRTIRRPRPVVLPLVSCRRWCSAWVGGGPARLLALLAWARWWSIWDR